MEKFIYHSKNYFNLKVDVSPMYFAFLYLFVTVVSTFMLVGVVDQTQLEAIVTGDVLRLDLFPRIGFAFYEFLLLPLYLKRMQDMGWNIVGRDMAILALFIPVVLATVLSDGGYEISAPLIGLLRLMALMLTFFLFVIPTKK
ncbi:MAG: hypothetical protein ACI9TY_000554 [Alphaproteobacteria bacterium]|jgi:hypothetical protein